ncbi:hypothetical protein [Aliikangiella sp. IMCC44359]|uniref:hypothetical protein n=1 Tax=Aliikangiella sp. IMCC44359 TaxID=3459125 RepID=UPI00403B1C85
MKTKAQALIEPEEQRIFVDDALNTCTAILWSCPPVTEDNARDVLRDHIKAFVRLVVRECCDDAAIEELTQILYPTLCKLRGFKCKMH